MYSQYHLKSASRRRKIPRLRWLAIALFLSGGTLFGWHALAENSSASASPHTAKHAVKNAGGTTTQTPALTHCASNTLDKAIIVSISARHLWACAGQSQQYDSAVVTGMQNIPADLTPIGTYQIYGKQANLYLDGSDSTGSWHDYVYYWMPFLHNQYGTYGFHDATWRADSEFGNVDPYSSQGSHGCVELPLATAKWIYTWAENGTTVQIIS